MQFALFLFSDGLKMLHGFTADQNRLAATVNGKESFGRMHLKATADLTRMISLAKERAALDPSVQSEVQQLVQEQAENRVNDLDRRVALTVDAFTQLARIWTDYREERMSSGCRDRFRADFSQKRR